MTATDTRFDQLRSLFSAELEERVRALSAGLLQLEQSRGDESARGSIFDALFREAHSLKGASRMVRLDHIERLAHTLESALDTVRKRGAVPPPAWFDALQRATDVFTLLDQPGATPPPDFEILLITLSATPEPASAAVQANTAERRPEPIMDPAVEPVREPAPEPTATTTAATRTTSVRVSTTKLDALLAEAGELSVTQLRVARRLAELRELERDLSAARREARQARLAPAPSGDPDWIVDRVAQIIGRFRDDAAQLALVTQSIQSEVMTSRLLPVSTITHGCERVVRDMTRGDEKEARLVLEGTDTEIDRKILEELQDPLIHLLRNAVDHGIEPADVRAAAGKPRAGTIRVSARQVGDTVRFEVADDGAGLDAERLRAAAVRKGLLTQEQGAALDENGAHALIFLAGFSSRETVSATSGRGVGLDVVREHVERLHGTVDVTSQPGHGTRFTLDLPLTLATTRALLVEQSGQTYAVPTTLVERSGRIEHERLEPIQGRLTLTLDGRTLPAIELCDVLGLAPAAANRQARTVWRQYFVVAQAGRRVALLVDALAGEQEIVVKSLAWPLRRVRNVAGTTLLGTGSVVVILNPSDLIQTALGLGTGRVSVTSPAVQAESRRAPRILVVDDSLTTRTLERTILEAAGYAVTVAADGLEALNTLRDADIDLVVSDVEMPRLDGFGLTAELRRDERLRHVPVVLITSLDAREHRERGVEVGADAYVVKSAFDQGQLLETIGRLL